MILVTDRFDAPDRYADADLFISILVMLGQEPEAAIADLRLARPKVWPNLAVLSLGAACLDLDESFMLLARVTNTRILLERAENFRF